MPWVKNHKTRRGEASVSDTEEPGGLPALSGRRAEELLTLHFSEGTANGGRVAARSAAATLRAADDLVNALSRYGQYADHAAPKLQLQATAEGSLELQLVLEAFGEFWSASTGFIMSSDVQAPLSLAGFAALVGGVVKWLKEKGRKREISEEVDGDGQVVTELEDGETLVGSPEVVEAAKLPRVQSAAKDFIAAGTMNGTKMTIHAHTVNFNTVVHPGDADQIPDPAENAPEAKVREYDASATFERPDFGGDIWKVRTTRDVHMMRIEDEDFLRRIDQGSVTLGKYSEFRVHIIEEPRITRTGQTRYDRRVTKIEPVLEREVQHELPYEPEERAE